MCNLNHYAKWQGGQKEVYSCLYKIRINNNTRINSGFCIVTTIKRLLPHPVQCYNSFLVKYILEFNNDKNLSWGHQYMNKYCWQRIINKFKISFLIHILSETNSISYLTKSFIFCIKIITTCHINNNHIKFKTNAILKNLFNILNLEQKNVFTILLFSLNLTGSQETQNWIHLYSAYPSLNQRQ